MRLLGAEVGDQRLRSGVSASMVRGPARHDFIDEAAFQWVDAVFPVDDGMAAPGDLFRRDRPAHHQHGKTVAQAEAVSSGSSAS